MLLGIGARAWAQEQSFSVSGFVSATLYAQQHLTGFADGPRMEWTTQELSEDPWFLSGDIGNTRLRFTWRGPEVKNGWKVSAALEADFYGFRGGEPFGDEQPNLRARLAFVDISNGTTTLRIGQFWSPLFGEVPASLSHIAFPLGYGSAGTVGWRYPGIFLYHQAAPNVQLQFAVMEGSGWVPAGGAGGISDGNAALFPQIEARINVSGKSDNFKWRGYLAGHFDQKDANGAGKADMDNYSGWLIQVGGQIQPGQFTLHGNAYYGRGMGNQFAHITQPGDVQGFGGWLQAGIALSPEWSLWVFYGIDDPDEDQFRRDTGGALTRWKNQMLVGMLRYSLGRYALGLEVIRTMTDYADGTRSANQIALSIFYRI